MVQNAVKGASGEPGREGEHGHGRGKSARSLAAKGLITTGSSVRRLPEPFLESRSCRSRTMQPQVCLRVHRHVLLELVDRFI